MNVWILSQGEDYEGGNVQGVFASLNAALKYAGKRRGWSKWSPYKFEVGKPGAILTRHDKGCDWQQIVEMEVKE